MATIMGITGIITATIMGIMGIITLMGTTVTITPTIMGIRTTDIIVTIATIDLPR